MFRRSLIAVCLTTVVPFLAGRTALAEFPGQSDISDLFSRAGLEATFVIESLDGHERYVFNEDRAGTRFCPASTFKVPNTLIALDFGAVHGGGIEFRWDGTDRSVDAWNRDQSLASALKVSCVWCYQEIARQVGRESYERSLSELDYGNAVVGDRVDRFWLDGSLRISAFEQVEFLRRLRQTPSPFSNEQMALLDRIMTIHSGEGYTLRAKSGWTGAGQHIGWYVGSVHSADDAWLFAMNFDMYEASDASLRQSLTVEALKLLGVLPEDWQIVE